MSKKKTILQIEAPSPIPGKYDYDVEGGNLPKLVGKVLSAFVVDSNLKFFLRKLGHVLCYLRVNYFIRIPKKHFKAQTTTILKCF